MKDFATPINPPDLFSTFKIGGTLLANRIIMAPMSRGRCDPYIRIPSIL